MLQRLTSAPLVLSNLQIYDSLLYEQDNPKYLRYPAANISMYFHFYNTYQMGLLKTGGRVVQMLI